MPRVLSNITNTIGEVGCWVLTIGYSGGITKGLLNEYFFGDVRWMGKNCIISINEAIKGGVVGGVEDCFITFFGFLIDQFSESDDCFFHACS